MREASHGRPGGCWGGLVLGAGAGAGRVTPVAFPRQGSVRLGVGQTQGPGASARRLAVGGAWRITVCGPIGLTASRWCQTALGLVRVHRAGCFLMVLRKGLISAALAALAWRGVVGCWSCGVLHRRPLAWVVVAWLEFGCLAFALEIFCQAGVLGFLSDVLGFVSVLVV